MNNNPMDGLNAGVGNIDVLKGTDVGVGMSGDVSEDIVGFVDSIWGSKQVVGATAERRLQESQQQGQVRGM